MLTDEEAAGRISWWWGAVLRRRMVAEWAALGLTVESVRNMSFDAVTQLLVEDRVVRAAARVLGICGVPEAGEHASGPVADMAAARVFLGAYLILGHPQAVFDDDGQSDRQTEQVRRFWRTRGKDHGRLARKRPRLTRPLSLGPRRQGTRPAHLV
jgi:hypothetical protein